MPAYSPDGSQIAFTSYLRGHARFVAGGGGAAGGRGPISKRPGMNSGADWSPDGRRHGAHPVVTRATPSCTGVDLDGTRSPPPDPGAVHRHVGHALARRLADRVRLRSRRLAPGLRDARQRRQPPPADVPGRQQHHPALEPGRQEAAHRLHRPGREGPVRHLHLRHADAEDRARHPEPGLQPEPGLVARRAPAGLRLQPRAACSSPTPRPARRCRSTAGGPTRPAGARRRGRASPGREAADAAGDDRHRHQHHAVAGGRGIGAGRRAGAGGTGGDHPAGPGHRQGRAPGRGGRRPHPGGAGGVRAGGAGPRGAGGGHRHRGPAAGAERRRFPAAGGAHPGQRRSR